VLVNGGIELTPTAWAHRALDYTTGFGGLEETAGRTTADAVRAILVGDLCFWLFRRRGGDDPGQEAGAGT
jgi:hypothetical protein